MATNTYTIIYQQCPGHILPKYGKKCLASWLKHGNVVVTRNAIIMCWNSKKEKLQL